MIYLVVKDNVCVNRVAYDGGNWSPPAGATIEPEGDTPVDIGWVRVDGVWTTPETEEIEEQPES